MHHGEAEAGALTDRLGGEERLEHPRGGLVVHPAAGVMNAQDGPPRVVRALDAFHANDDAAVARHGLSRVEAEIGDELVDLGFVGRHEDGIGGALDRELHLRAQGWAAQVGHRLDRRPEVDAEARRSLGTSERQHLACEVAPALAGADNPLERSARRDVGGKLHQRDLGRREDGGKHVVEVVSDTAREGADGLELLGLAEVDLELPLQGDVAGQQHPAAVRHLGLADPHPAAVGDMLLMIALVQLAQRQPTLEKVLAHLRVVDRADRDAVAQPVLEPFAQCQRLPEVGCLVLRVAAVVEHQPVLGVEDGEAIRQGLGRGDEAGLARAQGGLGLPLGGDVDREQHPATVRHPPLANAHPAAVSVLVLALGALFAAGGKTPAGVVRAHIGVVDGTTRKTIPNPILETQAHAQSATEGGGTSSRWRLL